MIVQIHCSFCISHSLIDNDKIRLVYKEDRTSVLQTLIMRILCHQDLFITFGLPKFSNGLCGLQVFLIQCQGIM